MDGGYTEKVENRVDAFQWPYGDLKVIKNTERLGLQKVCISPKLDSFNIYLCRQSLVHGNLNPLMNMEYFWRMISNYHHCIFTIQYGVRTISFPIPTLTTSSVVRYTHQD